MLQCIMIQEQDLTFNPEHTDGYQETWKLCPLQLIGIAFIIPYTFTPILLFTSFKFLSVSCDSMFIPETLMTVLPPSIFSFVLLFCFSPSLTSHLKTSSNPTSPVNSLIFVTIILSPKTPCSSVLTLYYHSHNTSDTRCEGFSPHQTIL